MKITGLQKMTLLDFPGRVACTVFLGGCNFRCPFCHNSQILDGSEAPLMEDHQLLEFLQKRKGILDGVCITGGEPTLQPELPRLLRAIKALGYPVKLDTNGYRPKVLEGLISEGLVDYVAMDIKNSPDAYAGTVGLQSMDLGRIEESIRILTASAVDHEFRTTVVGQFHNRAAMEQMGKWLNSTAVGKPKKLFLQTFVDRDTVMFAGLTPPTEEEMADYKEILAPYIGEVKIRGKD